MVRIDHSMIIIFITLLFYVYMYFGCNMHLHHIRAWCLQIQEEDSGFLGNRARDGFKTRCMCWESNLGPPQEQKVLITTESFLHPQHSVFFENVGNSVGGPGSSLSHRKLLVSAAECWDSRQVTTKATERESKDSFTD